MSKEKIDDLESGSNGAEDAIGQLEEEQSARIHKQVGQNIIKNHKMDSETILSLTNLILLTCGIVFVVVIFSLALASDQPISLTACPYTFQQTIPSNITMNNPHLICDLERLKNSCQQLPIRSLDCSTVENGLSTILSPEDLLPFACAEYTAKSRTIMFRSWALLLLLLTFLCSYTAKGLVALAYEMPRKRIWVPVLLALCLAIAFHFAAMFVVTDSVTQQLALNAGWPLLNCTVRVTFDRIKYVIIIFSFLMCLIELFVGAGLISEWKNMRLVAEEITKEGQQLRWEVFTGEQSLEVYDAYSKYMHKVCLGQDDGSDFDDSKLPTRKMTPLD